MSIENDTKVRHTRGFLQRTGWTQGVPSHGFVRKVLNATYARVQWVGNPHETTVCLVNLEEAP